MTYAFPAWEFAEDTHVLKLQCLYNKVCCMIGKFSKCTPIHELHMAFQVPYIYDYITKCAGNKCRSYKIMKMQMFVTSLEVKPDRKYKRLKLGSDQAYDHSSE
jgi:hypothetical protein